MKRSGSFQYGTWPPTILTPDEVIRNWQDKVHHYETTCEDPTTLPTQDDIVLEKKGNEFKVLCTWCHDHLIGRAIVRPYLTPEKEIYIRIHHPICDNRYWMSLDEFGRFMQRKMEEQVIRSDSWFAQNCTLEYPNIPDNAPPQYEDYDEADPIYTSNYGPGF